MKDRVNQPIPLRDGRRLGYAEYGDTTGRPLFYFHGIPGSRKELLFDEASLTAQGVRLIVPDRPGYGLSDRLAHRRILDWPDDVIQLADSLNLAQFHVFGFSGGGSYALACAHRLPERVMAVGLLGCVAPLDAPGMRDTIPPSVRDMYTLAAQAPEALTQHLAPLVAAPEGVLQVLAAGAPEPDRAAFADPVRRDRLLTDFTEALCQDAQATAWDLHLIASPWGFDLRRIQQPVHLWQGTLDQNAGSAMGHYLAEILPCCHARFLEGEGHYSPFTHMGTMLEQLMDH